MIRRISLLIAVVGLASCASQFDRVDGLSIEIVDHGIFTTFETEKAMVTDRELVTTDSVPFVPGTVYGLVLRVDGEPAGARTAIKLQWAITPASVTNKRKLARLQQPRMREVVTGQSVAMTATIGAQSYRRPWKHLFFVTDMNGNVLERKEFTIVDAPE